MPLEPSVTYIADLNPAWPTGADFASISDDNHRNLKKALLACFAGFAGAVQVTGVDGGTVNAYTLTPANALPAYGTKMIAVFSPTISNTGACTLTIGGLAVKDLLSVAGNPLVIGDLVVGNIYVAFYDGTQFRLTSVTKNYVDQLVFGGVLPAQPGNATKTLRTDGSASIWDNARLYNSVRTSNTILGDADGGRLIDYTAGNFTQTFSGAAIVGEGWWVRLRNSSATDDIEVEAPAAVSTSSVTSNSIAAGTVWTVATGLAIVAGDLVILRRTADPFNQRIIATVASYVSGTGVLTITPTYRIGSGTFTDWTITTRAATAGIDGKASYVMMPNECRDFTMRSGALVSMVLAPYTKEINSSTTFIKPPGYRRRRGMAESGGQSGGRSGGAGVAYGGNGGGAFPFDLPESIFPEATPIIVGAGGLPFSGVSVGNAAGNTGGNTQIGSPAIITVVGALSSAGGAVINCTGVNPGTGAATGFESYARSTSSIPSVYGGISPSSNDASQPNASSVFGGPCGGHFAAGTIYSPGVNSVGAVGGVAGNAVNGSAGTGPGAGGGATATGTQSGAGNAGRVTFTGA